MRPFELILSDLFCFFFSFATSLQPEGVCDRLHCLLLKYVMESEEYGALRRRTIADYHSALAAVEEFGARLLEYLEATGRAAAGVNAGSETAKEPVHIEGVVFAERAVSGGAPAGKNALLVIAKQIEQATDTMRVLADVCHQWGFAPGEIRGLPYAQRAALAQRMNQSRNLQRLAELVGRYRALARARKARRVAGTPEEVQDVTVGDEWPRFLSQELVALVHPALRYDFYRRVIDRQVFQYDPRGPEGRGKGPIITCVDTSGSMAGDRDLAAKATALALLDIARKERRPYAAILFSSPGEWISFRFQNSSVDARMVSGEHQKLTLLEGILRTGTDFFGGGTDYESPLNETVCLIADGHEVWRHADVVFITDDYCDVSEAFLTRFSTGKRALEFKVFSVIIGARAEDARTLRKFSDRIVSSAEFYETVAEQIFDAV
jgi:uncharacterized protein with von Willebrand factor type A (vWA) domain